MIILGSESCYDYASAVKVLAKAIGPEQTRDSEAVAFDPVLGCQVDCREGRETAICWTGDDEVLEVDVSGRRNAMLTTQRQDMDTGEKKGLYNGHSHFQALR